MHFKTKFAVFSAKLTQELLRMLGKNGTQLTGVVAEKLDRGVLSTIEKPKHTIAVTGTNGKTSTTNMIDDVLIRLDIDPAHNRYGSNTGHGIISSLIEASTYGAHMKKTYGIFEVDELWTPTILPAIRPSTLTITNLFQDSFERNLNVHYIVRTIESAIPTDTRLILNASDAIVGHMNTPNEKIFFDVAIQPGEAECLNSKIQDVIYAPGTTDPLIWDFKRYHHHGQYHSADGSFTNPKADYLVTRIDAENALMHIDVRGEALTLPLVNETLFNVYNQIAAYATLRENGFDHEPIARAMSALSIVSSRYEAEQIGAKSVHSYLAKGNNPIANSRIMHTMATSGDRFTVIYNVDYLDGPGIPTKSLGWIFITDYHFIADKLDKLIIRTKFAHAVKLAALMDGIPEEKILIVDDAQAVAQAIDPTEPETIYLLHDMEGPCLEAAERILAALRERCGK